MILFTHPKDKNGHVRVDFICAMCGKTQSKNLSKQPADICSKCLYGPYKFINKVKLVHGEKYKYLLETYTRSTEVMNIVCSDHGVFSQRPSDHVQGQACPKCSKKVANANLRKTEQQFIKQILKIYEDKLDISKLTYVDATTAVVIPCPVHGDQQVLPANLMAGYATCKKCLPKYIDTHLFIDKAKKVHGDTYSYLKTQYQDARSKIIITCSTHGDFLQNPMGHIDGRGCSKCAVRGFNPGKSGFLYYLYIPEVEAYKIGVTNFGIKERYLSYERKQFIVLKLRFYEDGSKAKAIEQWLIKRYSMFKYTGINPLNSGSTEMFNRDILSFTQDTLIAQGDLVIS